VPIRIVLAEDNLLIREGVRRLLEAQDDVQLVASCGDYDSLLTAVEAERPDVVITDIRMPPTGTDEGIRAADRLRTSHPQTGVVVLSQYDDADYALAFLERARAASLPAQRARLQARSTHGCNSRGCAGWLGD